MGVRFKLFNDARLYDENQMFSELNQLLEVCLKTAQVQTALQVILTKGRISQCFDPLSAVPRVQAKGGLDGYGEYAIQILDYKTEEKVDADLNKEKIKSEEASKQDSGEQQHNAI